jgi:membrane dipeptidase
MERILRGPLVVCLLAALALPASAAGPASGQPVDAALVTRARALLAAAPLIDTHNDLPSMLLEKYRGDLTKVDLAAVQSALCADVPRLVEGGVGAQYWSVFVESKTMSTHTALHEALREFDVTLRLIRSQPRLELARTADDIERIHRAGKIASLIGVEGGHMIEQSPAALRVFYELGGRYMTLTHWDNVEWADSATDRPEHDGLTKRGEAIVREMNRLGMFVDISHVSADTMRDVLRVTRAPVIFSHSNALALAGHPRNAPDDVLKALAENGGVIHVNFIGAFVAPDHAAWEAREKAAKKQLQARVGDDAALAAAVLDWEKANPEPRGSVALVADQFDHIVQVAGVDHVGIGSDFYDDGATMVPGLENVTRYPYLFAELLRRGYSDEDVMKIAGRNHLRAMRRMEKVAAELRKTEPPLILDGPDGQ